MCQSMWLSCLFAAAAAAAAQVLDQSYRHLDRLKQLGQTWVCFCVSLVVSNIELKTMGLDNFRGNIWMHIPS